MPEYFLRVDAVNLAHFVYDTHDISTIRGGSYILLDSIIKLKQHFDGRMKAISTAASQGIFSFECPKNSDETAYSEKLQKEVLTFLSTETSGQATFVATVEKGDCKFPDVLEKLEAQIHRQQWRFPTVAIPEYKPTNQECYLDGWRPGVEEYRVDPDVPDKKISTSTQNRRERGRQIKQKLFEEQLGKKYAEQICVKDLSLLAKDKSQGILNGKIAYIQTDGNSFGKLRRKFCISPDARGAFDKVIQEDFRNSFLKTLLQRADADPDFKTKDEEGNEALRVEVLVWGGDEMTLVVPAWKGLEVLELFYQQAANSSSFNGEMMTHKAAIVFCHHNMPILQIRAIAEKLLVQTKKDIHQCLDDLFAGDPDYRDLPASKKEELYSFTSDPQGNACHYLALESLDMLGGSLEKFIQNYYQQALFHQLLLNGDEIGRIRATITTMKSELAYGQVLKVLETLQQGNMTNFDTQKEKMLGLVPKNKIPQVKDAINTLTKGQRSRWYLLADLWNYVTER
jgi:hypothetical protein